MTSTNQQFLRTLFLIFTAFLMCFPESLSQNSNCDDKSVYHYQSSTCLRVYDTEIEGLWLLPIFCEQYKGGQHRNVSGHLTRVDPGLKVFLGDYLQYLAVPRAAVSVSDLKTLPENLIDQRNNQSQVCQGFVSFSVGNLALISLSEGMGAPDYSKMSPCRYSGPVFCQVESAGTASVTSGCPSNVTVESVSDRNVMLYIAPGETKTQARVRFSVFKACDNITTELCRNFETTLDKKIFLDNPRTHSLVGLEPSTRYSAHLMIDGKDGLAFDCKDTVDFTTEGKVQPGEYHLVLIIGFSVGLACILCFIVVLAVICYSHRKRTREGHTKISPVRFTSTPNEYNRSNEVTQNNFTVANITNNCNSEIGNYANLEVTGNVYDEPSNERDVANEYEM